jgi:hypothetical protein
MTSTPEPAVERLIAAHDLALAALREITPEETIGEAAGYTVEDDAVVSLRFANRMPGYPSWFWTVTLAVVGEDEPTVLEAELLPGEGALLAPDWVPWAVRLAEYQATQAALADAAAAEDASPDDEDDDDTDVDVDVDEDDDDDDDDLDDEGVDELDDDDDDGIDDFEATSRRGRTHAGDVDGVDIDELDDADGEDDLADPDDGVDSEDDPEAEGRGDDDR